MPKIKHVFTKEILFDLYKNQRKTVSEIGEILGCGSSTVHRSLKKFGFEPNSAGAKLFNASSKKYLEDKEWLLEKFNNGFSAERIAEEIGCNFTTVYNAFKKYEIIANPVGGRFKFENQEAKKYLEDKEWLLDQYKTKLKSANKISYEIGCTNTSVFNYLRKHKIESNQLNDYPELGSSLEEQELYDFIQTIYQGKIIQSEREILDGSEIDIYIPELKIGFEYNGIYWHRYQPEASRDCDRKGWNYHLNKTNIAEQKGVRLIQIWSSDWNNKKEIVMSMVANRLHCTKTKIYARKCQIVELDSWTKNKFLDENHIQGKVNARHKIGLMHQNELVAVMTFGIAEGYKYGQWDLSRFATKLNTNVVGGFSKMLKYFRSKYSGSIVSYANRMHSKGEVYEKNGFRLSHINKPAYHYMKPNINVLENRQKFMKHKIANGPDDTRTEFEIMTDLGYHRIYDCGTITYVYD